MEQDTFPRSIPITCVIDRTGNTTLMSQEEAGAFLMSNPRLVTGIHPASMQPFAETAGSGQGGEGR
ncbi:MAG: hypothetical protein J0H98_10620 [Solirubrobacterales bacterium]|nr:hypothetical protein [Solirubrobacterales bacterium]